MQGRFLSRNHLVGEFVLSEELHHPNILRICRLFSVNPFAAPKNALYSEIERAARSLRCSR
jgi:hypothetical protein